MLVSSSTWQPLIQSSVNCAQQFWTRQLQIRICINMGRRKFSSEQGCSPLWKPSVPTACMRWSLLFRKIFADDKLCKKQQKLRHSTVKIQSWWRGILAKRSVEQCDSSSNFYQKLHPEETLFGLQTRDRSFPEPYVLPCDIDHRLIFRRCARYANQTTISSRKDIPRCYPSTKSY